MLGPGEPEQARQNRHDYAVECGRRERQTVRPAEPQVHKDEQRKEHRDLVHLQQMQCRLVKGLQHEQPSACHGYVHADTALVITVCGRQHCNITVRALRPWAAAVHFCSRAILRLAKLQFALPL